MGKRRREEISLEDSHRLRSVITDLADRTIPPLIISEVQNIEEQLLGLDHQKKQLIESNPGPITQWPRRYQERWYALIARYEELISLEDIRKLNPGLCE